MALWLGPIFMVAFAVAFSLGVANERGKPAIAAGLFAVAAVTTIVAYALRRRDVRLWREGEQCPGEVTRSWTEGRGVSDSKVVRRYVEYRYVHRGQSFLGQQHTRFEWEPGVIWVVCDPARPERSLPYPRLD